MKISPFEKTKILVEALPYVNRFKDSIFVIKYGGNAMISDELRHAVMQDLHTLKSVGIHPVLVHGGGPAINKALQVYGIESEFINGLRYTSKEAIDIVEMVLSGGVNKQIVGLLDKVGADAVGLSGRDYHLVRANRKFTSVDGEEKDLGYVGEVSEINTEFLKSIICNGAIPVIASIGVDKNGDALNINADELAGALAKELQAEKFVLLTDVEGIFMNYEDRDSVITNLNFRQIEHLKKERIIKGGMLPKVDCCMEAIESGVTNAHILDGRVKHALLLEIFSKDGIGTMIGR